MTKGYLLDTNICIYLFKGKYNIREKLIEVGLKHFSSQKSLWQNSFMAHNAATM